MARIKVLRVLLALPLAVLSTDLRATELASESDHPITLSDGRLSVDLNGITLDAALTEIAARAGFTLDVRGALTSLRQRQVTDLPLDEGLQHLLEGYDLVMRLAPDNSTGSGQRVTALVVLGRKQDPLGQRPSDRSQQFATTSPGYRDFAAQPRRRRWHAIGDLDRQGDREAALLLREILAQDPDPGIRTTAASALSRAPRRIAGAALTAALDDPEARVRIQAIRSLRAVQGWRALRRLQELALHDRDPEVRRMAVHLSASLGGRAATRVFESALTDPTQEVRDAASSALQDNALN